MDQISVPVAHSTGKFRQKYNINNTKISDLKSSEGLLSIKISFGIQLFKVVDDLDTPK